MTFVYGNMPEAYRAIIKHIIDFGRNVSPRGMITKELIGYSFSLEDPAYNVVTQATRKVSLPFMAAEGMWILSGSNDARLITPYNSNIKAFADDGLFFRGAYGPKVMDQMPYIIQTLRDDPESRQALLTIWRERPGPSKDIPCTITMQFFVRDQRLHMVVYMRSNDAWLGLPYDVYNFTLIQRYVASLLVLDVGRYHHHVGSLHLYQKNWAKAELLLREPLSFIPIVQSDPLTAPMPPEVLTVFTGMSLLGMNTGVTAKDVNSWIDLSESKAYPEWIDMLYMCAYRFHKDISLLPKQLRNLVMYWDNYIDKQAEEDVEKLGG
jgi:thymidylate synthase